MSKLLVTQYQRNVEELMRYGGSRNESSIRGAFQNLLSEYCKTRDFRLIPELEYRDRKIRPDGTVKDALRLDWGYWESKDQYDDLDLEIEKKFALGYPKDNIIFEDSQTAILFQAGQEQRRISMLEADALDALLQEFINYVRPEVKSFREALEQFKTDVPAIAEELRSRIAQASDNNPQFQTQRDAFLILCQQSINPNVSLDDVTEMIIQHILSEDIFTNVFNESQFHRENNIARSLSGVIETFFTRSVRRDTLKSIEHYYAVIKREAVNIANHHEKQKFLKVIYENFYKAYNPKAADRLGIVYTPNEIVRFMIESTDFLLDRHFGKLLQDDGVDILDPATGTGTFITELIEYLNPHRLRGKYLHEIHCNEVAILPYYIANLNIEFTYQQKMGEYEEFNNICLVDTLDHTAYHGKQMDLFAMTMENTKRINRQNEREISVIIGNPPYNAWQDNFNQNNANRPYKSIDDRIRGTYVKEGNAQNQIALYDMYVRFLRWASDRIGKNGIIAFVSNSSFVNSVTFDGFRKVVSQEFNELWVIDTKGNARNSGERRRKEGGNVFNDEIKVGIAVYFLVRCENLEGFRVYYNAVEDYAKSEEKQAYFIGRTLKDLSFDHVRPDKKHNWINLTDNDFDELLPLIDKEVKAARSQEAIFQLFSSGLQSKRDEWVYDFSEMKLAEKIEFFLGIYQDTLSNKKHEDRHKIKWNRELKKYLERNISKRFTSELITKTLYRPYVKQYLYFDQHINGLIFQWLSIYKKNKDNYCICCTDIGSAKPFMVLVSNTITDLHLVGAGASTQCLPLYRYDKDGNRHDNITDWALARFREHYAPSPNQDQARGLSPLFSMGEELPSQARGLISPLFSMGENTRQLWFVTFVTHNSRVSERMVVYGVEVGEPFIFSAEDQIFIAEKIIESGKRYDVEIITFNVLPDHVHMVVAAETQQQLSEHIRKIKGFCSYEFKRSHQLEPGTSIWAQKFNRQAIEDEEAFLNIVEYILNNHIKHTERWGETLISTWEVGLPDQGLRSLAEIVQDGCTGTRGLSPLSDPNQQPTPGTRGLSPLPGRGMDRAIQKLDIFHYVYAILHHPHYRQTYEQNLKRDFPRLPLYDDFWQWANWGKQLMELHLNYETIEPYPLQRIDIPLKPGKLNKPKLKPDKTKGAIALDEITTIQGIPAIAWDYQLGNRSAIEWVLDQHKEKTPKDPTIREKFNTYKFTDYKEKVIDLLMRVCTVSVETMQIIQEMRDLPRQR